ncbi:MAG: His-Xaa-Ser repeat protein HxsA3 [Blautia sp.]
MDKENIFPTIKKGLEDFIQEEEGNISRSKAAMIGSMMVILGVMLADGSVYAAHRSHSLHSSHRSHSSHSSHRSGSHSSHSSHSSGSHTSHSSGSHSSGNGTSGGNKYNVKIPTMQIPQSYTGNELVLSNL